MRSFCASAPLDFKAEALSRKGKPRDAANLYEQAGAFEKGAKVLEKAEEYPEAARLWRLPSRHC